MLAGLERIDGHRGVQVVRGGDGYGVDVRLFHQFAKIDIAARNPESIAGLTGPARVRFSDGHHRRPGTGNEAGKVFQAGGPSSNHRTAKLFGHN